MDVSKNDNHNLNQLSPLLLAAANGHTACVLLLLEHQASIYDKDEKGYNFLMKAIEKRHRYMHGYTLVLF